MATPSTFSSRCGLLAASATAVLALANLSGPLQAQTSIPINPQATYLHVNLDAALDATPIALAPLGLAPGMCVRLRSLGDYSPSTPGPANNDHATGLHAVFSSSAKLLAATQLHRVAGALEAGLDVLTANALQGAQLTDIAEDFAINAPGITEVTVKVPAGATHLFVSPSDDFFQDNSDPDGDFAVELTHVGCWKDLGFGLAGASGTPVLAGEGTLIGGSPTFGGSAVSLEITGANPNAAATLVVGFSTLNLPFKTGLIVPCVDILIPGLLTGPNGTLTLAATWPSGLPPGFNLYFQAWIGDAICPCGVQATNGLSATTP